jgi:hypothetical protein
LEKIAGGSLVKIYNLANGVLFCFLAGAMITVSATAVGIPFGMPMPGIEDTMPNSAGFVMIVLAVGLVIAVVASLGYATVAKFANVAQRITPIAFWISPLLAFVSPAASRVTLGIAVLSILASTLVHLITLPVEWDASFGKALPILEKGEYLNEEDMKNAHQILLAAALTYVAGSLASLLNVWRWLKYLRR